MHLFKSMALLPAIIILTFISIKPAAAFWPFDLLTDKTDSTEFTTDTTTPTLLEKIIEKFGLNKDQVNQVITEYQSERRTQMQTAFETRLTQAVENGKITTDQKQLILDKHNQLQIQQKTQFQNRQQHQQELQTWAAQNGIDLNYLEMGLGRGGHRGMMSGDGMGMVRGK